MFIGIIHRVIPHFQNHSGSDGLLLFRATFTAHFDNRLVLTNYVSSRVILRIQIQVLKDDMNKGNKTIKRYVYHDTFIINIL